MKADSVYDTVKTKAAGLKRGMGNFISTARDTAGDLYTSASRRARTWSHDGVDYVREHPVKTLLTAVAVGFTLGFLSKRRREAEDL